MEKHWRNFKMKNNNFKDNEICFACKDMINCGCPCDILTSNSLDVDYKEIINEIQDARKKRQIRMIENIEGVSDSRLRLILGGLFFSVSVADIAEFLHLTREHIYKIIKPLRKTLND